MNLGILLGRKPTDWIGGSIPYQNINPSGDWTPFLPDGELQYSSKVDDMDCVSESTTHSIETQIFKLTGIKRKFSVRWLAKMSNTTPQGNFQNVVADTVRKYGLVDYDLWPDPTEGYTWDEYYATIPADIIAKGQDFLNQFQVNYQWLGASQIPQALQQAPVTIVITAENPYHDVMLLNNSQYFDSYEPFLKTVGTVHDYLQIVVTQSMGMTAEEVKYHYILAFYREPTADELAYWTGKLSLDFLKQAIHDRGVFLSTVTV